MSSTAVRNQPPGPAPTPESVRRAGPARSTTPKAALAPLRRLEGHRHVGPTRRSPEARQALYGAVNAARAAGATFHEIGEALQVTRQRAHQVVREASGLHPYRAR